MLADLPWYVEKGAGPTSFKLRCAPVVLLAALGPSGPRPSRSETPQKPRHDGSGAGEMREIDLKLGPAEGLMLPMVP